MADFRSSPSPARMRSVQFTATVVTILLTAWMCRLGFVSAIIALLVAKHVLVAILLMNVGLDRTVPVPEIDLIPGIQPTEEGRE
jgi:hypothetical protein